MMSISSEPPHQTTPAPARSRAEDARDALVLLDDLGRVSRWDDVAIRLTGFDVSEVVGRPFPGFADPAGGVAVLLERAERVGWAEAEGGLLRKDGTRFRVQAVVTAVRDHAGKLHSFTMALHDLTGYRKARRTQRRARLAVLHTQRMKSEFLANVSHELRTPLGAVLGFSEVALDSAVDPEQRQLLERIHANATNMLTLIVNLLDLAKSESHQLEIEVTPFDLRQLVRDALTAAASRAHHKKIELCCDIKPEVPKEVLGQPTRLAQVLSNLLDNATKFTDAGEIVLTVALDPTYTGRDALLQFSIADTGIGIPADKHGIVFEPFVQLDGSMNRRHGGAGLGLAVARQLVEFMGGEIWIESTAANSGTTIHFTLHVTLTPDEALTVAPFADCTVLVADDNPTERRLLLELVARWGMTGIAAADGSAAIAALRSGSIDGQPLALVLVDADMSHRGGTYVLEHLERRPRARIPVVLLTSPQSSADLLRYRRVEVAGYVSKPIVDSALRNVLSHVFDRTRSRRRA